MLNRCNISGFADEAAVDFKEQLRVMDELDVHYIELRTADGIGVADITEEKAAELKKVMDEAGVKVSAVGSPIGKIGVNDPMEPHLESLRHMCRLAKIWGARYIRMFSFYIPDGDDPAAWKDEVFRRTALMKQTAKEEGVVLLHENEKGIYGDVASRCLELMQEFYDDNYRCTFDFANFVQCGQDTMEAYEMLKPYIEYIHIKDARFADGGVVPAGEGDGQVAAILSKLDAAGFAGFLSIEPHLTDFEGLNKLARHINRAGKRMDDKEAAWKIAHEALMSIVK